MRSKAKPTPAALGKLEAIGQKLTRLKGELVAVERDASAAGFRLEPVHLLLGRLARPRLPRPVIRIPGQLEFAFMAAAF